MYEEVFFDTRTKFYWAKKIGDLNAFWERFFL